MLLVIGTTFELALLTANAVTVLISKHRPMAFAPDGNVSVIVAEPTQATEKSLSVTVALTVTPRGSPAFNARTRLMADGVLPLATTMWELVV